MEAESLFDSATVRHAFLYNTDTNTGYLFSDQELDGTFEIGIVIAQAGTAATIDYWNIV
jgi:hypothetical protein